MQKLIITYMLIIAIFLKRGANVFIDFVGKLLQQHFRIRVSCGRASYDFAWYELIQKSFWLTNIGTKLGFGYSIQGIVFDKLQRKPPLTKALIYSTTMIRELGGLKVFADAKDARKSMGN